MGVALGSRLAQLLAQHQLLAISQVEALSQEAIDSDRELDEVLLEREVFRRDQLVEILENQTFCPSVDLHTIHPSLEALERLPQRLARQHLALPFALDGERLKVALQWPDDRAALRQLRTATHCELVPFVALSHELREAIDRHYANRQQALDALREIDEAAAADSKSQATPMSSTPARKQSAPRADTLELSPSAPKKLHGADSTNAIELLQQLLDVAVQRDATDLHLQPQKDGLWCRLRVDGVLQNVASFPLESAAALTSRLKIIGGMDIAEHRRPQDGRCHLDAAGRALDLRISVMPSQWGEKVVARLLRRDLELLDLEQLRLPPAVRADYQSVLDTPQGFYLVTGPTGSGKTTTLYSTLSALDSNQLNISTLEDPIEYSLPGISQMQIQEEIGFDFSSGLRALLRQDPDVLLVGEIRDVETLEVACRAALTGHKVLSTLHTNDACQAITRLLEMGAEPFLISATLRGVLGQRLVRTICEDCREEYEMEEVERVLLGYPQQTTLQRGRGCARCGHTGYHGRQGIYEYFKVDESIHALIQNGASPHTIRYAARKSGMLTMAEFGRHAVLEGKTTLAEIQRVILADEAKEQLCHSCQRVVDLDFSVCPHCHAKLKDECPACHRPVESGWEACAHCGEPLEQEWQKKYCRSCLAPVHPEWDRCHYCHTELPA
jgi:type IV pilus assembly protein PilB